jgi:hypothetical protein
MIGISRKKSLGWFGLLAPAMWRAAWRSMAVAMPLTHKVDRVGSLGLLVLVIWLMGPTAAGEPVATSSAPAADADSSRSSLLSDEEWRLADRSTSRALVWLAAQQNTDGSFHSLDNDQPAVTALCVLALLSRGNLADQDKYGKVIHKGIDFVLNCQQPDGLVALRPPDSPVSHHSSSHTAHYNHAIGGLLLSESLGMGALEQSTRIRKSVQAAVAYSLKRHLDPKRSAVDIGGWRYAKPHLSDDSDLSVTSWQLMFLRSSRNAGFDVSARDIEAALDYVRRCFATSEGTFTYALGRERRFTRGMAGAGIIALSLGGQHRTDAALKAGDWILWHPFDQFGETYGDGDRFFYGAFYCSQAMFQLGGRYWRGFYPPLLKLLVRSQESDGSWPPESSGEQSLGSIYSTALAVLALSAPDQMLPVFQR